MGEIVNLRRARKAKARAEGERRAAANRIAHGRTRAEREATKAETELQVARLDGHRRDKPSDPA
jgi:hypothetical protein